MAQYTQASLSFEPVTIEATQGDIIPVDVLIYSGTDPVISSDMWIAYDPTRLELDPKQHITQGPLFRTVDFKLIEPGSIYLYAINQVDTTAPGTNGQVATLYFKALTSGDTQLRFECAPFEEQTSQIIKHDPALTNIINCDSTRRHTASVTIEPGDNVLGIADERTFLSNPWYIAVAFLLLILTGILFIRYRTFMNELKIK